MEENKVLRFQYLTANHFQELIERIIQSIIKSEADKPAVEEDVEENDDLLDKKILCGDAQLQRLLGIQVIPSFTNSDSQRITLILSSTFNAL